MKEIYSSNLGDKKIEGRMIMEIDNEKINEDIHHIDEILKDGDEKKIRQFHIWIDGKYSSYIPDWGHSMYGYNDQSGFLYETLGTTAMIHNLNVMMAKLVGYKNNILSNRGGDQLNKIEAPKSKVKKIFVSHSSDDLAYVEKIVELLEAIGVQEDEIVCSSVPPYCVPLNNGVYDWLVNRFQSDELWVLFILSQNYYSSPACLNEMGAAWAMKQKWTGILLPDFEFHQIRGCIDSSKIGIKLGDDDLNTLKYRLSELKDLLTDEFGLRPMSNYVWERKRDRFIRNIEDIQKSETQDIVEDKLYEIKNEEEVISVDASVVLVYASEEANGQIIVASYLSGVAIQIGNINLIKKKSAREIARWKAAVEELETKRFIQRGGSKGEIFRVTKAGYEKADDLRKKLAIDTKSSFWEFVPEDNGGKENG